MESHYLTQQDLVALSKDEEKILSTILQINRSKNIKEKENMLKTLANYPPRLLYAFSEKNPEIHFLLENDKHLNLRWSTRLQEMGYPYHRIKSFDGTMEVSLFSQLKGAVLMKEINACLESNGDLGDNKIFPLLNKACDLGIYQALVLRLNYYTSLINKVGNKNHSNEDAETYIQYQFRDAHKLSNLYWAIGCIDSSLILFNVVDYYFGSPVFLSDVNRFFSNAGTSHFSWSTKYDDKNRPYPIAILEVAVENIYIAKLLSEFPESELITEQITHGEGLLSGFENTFSNMDEVQNFVMERLKSLKVPLIESFCKNAYNHSVDSIHILRSPAK